MDSYNMPPPIVQRVATLKRGRTEDDSKLIKLEQVLGVTVSSNAALDSNPTCSTIAYPAGCTVVLLNTATAEQRHIINGSRKAISSLAFSPCGRYLVTGEYGHQPAVRVWDLQSDVLSPGPGLAPQLQQVAESVHHTHGVQCVAFSPTNKYVVSIGTQHDMIVNVWDWRGNIKVASNKVSSKVKAVAFSDNGSYFVTVGNRFVKFWFLEYAGGGNSNSTNSAPRYAHNKETAPLLGRPAILGDLRNNYFYGVGCGKGECGDSTYAITRSGLLCEFNSRRLLDKWVELRTSSANCITVGESLIFVGCADGIVRCFDPRTLRFVTTLPRSHYLGVDVAAGLTLTHTVQRPPNAHYPDTVAITYDSTAHHLTCIYNDHSVYVWDIGDIRRVGKILSYLYHSACIWGVEMAPPVDTDLTIKAEGVGGLPSGSFVTCSSDDTIRVWSVDGSQAYRGNVYSKELLKVVYVDKELTFIKDGGGSGGGSAGGDSAYDSRHGVRSIKISPDGKHLASGDRAGNIRIHDTTTLAELCKIEAHDAEVLCLEYTGLDATPSHTPTLTTPTPHHHHHHHRMLASASRDRFIHVFDVDRDYKLLQTLTDHSSSITAVRFMQGKGGGVGVGGGGGGLQMVSCCADKSLIFRSLSTQTDPPQFERYNTAIGKTTLYDMVVDASEKHVLTACMDRNVRVYNVNSGKHTKTFKGSPGDDGTLVKVALDRSGLYLASSCTDKSVSLYDYYTSECMATMYGHSELSTGLRFTNDCRRLISASGDGCIFVWKIPHDMVVTMHARLSQQATRQGKTFGGFGDESDFNRRVSEMDISDPNNSRSTSSSVKYTAKRDDFSQESFEAMPRWARRHLDPENYRPSPPRPEPNRGKWGKFDMRKFIEENGEIYSGRDADTETESMDSGTDGHRSNLQKPPVPLRPTSQTCDSALGSLKDHESEAHHADIDSDQEQESYYHGDGQEVNSGEFTVKNIDADELRQSTRRSKWNTISNLDIVRTNGVSASSSPNSEDDDEASTPSGENTDRNPMSLLSASSESLDKLVNREQYFRSTFDSMNGNAGASSSFTNKSSISAQYGGENGSANSRNQNIINAAFATKNNPEALRKRQELTKSISDIRKTLDRAGSRSPSMRNSRSTHDVSHIPEKEQNSRKQNDCTPTFQRSASSVPSNLQLCGCFLKDIAKNKLDISSLGMMHHQNLTAAPAKLSDILIKSPERSQQNLAALIRPRKLKLDKTLNKYKHKSLPVSPVSEECRLADFAETSEEFQGRRSVSYYVDLDEKNQADIGFKQICDDIEKFSRDFSKNYEQIEHIFKTTSLQTTPTTFLEASNELAKTREPPKVLLFDPTKDDDDSNFSSDSLEDCSFKSTRNPKSKKITAPRRCVSNNEIYNHQIEDIDYSKYLHAYDCEVPKSESFYLNPSNKNSQDSILSDELDDLGVQQSKSYCNSLESILSNESDCKSAPLEILFRDYNDARSQSQYEACYSKSMPKNTSYYAYENAAYNDENNLEIRRSKSLYSYNNLKTIQTQTELKYEPDEVSAPKRTNISQDFQKKLLKFERCIAQNDLKKNPIQIKPISQKGIAFFVDTKQPTQETVLKDKQNTQMKNSNIKKSCAMYIPSLETKNRQYKSKFCNVLNNKPEINLDIFETRAKSSAFTLTNFNIDKAPVKQETASLDRHLLSKSLTDCEKICHKPPKAVRRHSSKVKKVKTSYEYIRKEDFFKEKKVNNVTAKRSNENQAPSNEKCSIEISFKENNVEYECENSNTNYDSLDKYVPMTKMDVDSLDFQSVQSKDGACSEHLFDSLEIDPKNIWNQTEPDKVFTTKIINKTDEDTRYNNKIQQSLHQIKLLNEIQRKILQINELVEIVAKSVTIGKVRALSCMFDNMANSKTLNAPFKYRKRNLSLPNFGDSMKLSTKEELNIIDGIDSAKSCVKLLPKEEKVIVEKVLLNDSYSSNLRRSISLSDLLQVPIEKTQKRKTGTKPKPAPRNHHHHTNHPHHYHHPGSDSSLPSHHNNNNNNINNSNNSNSSGIYRSRSTAALPAAGIPTTASDSDDTETTGGYNSSGGGGGHRPGLVAGRHAMMGGAGTGGSTTTGNLGGAGVGGGTGGGVYRRLMRPTISSQNKTKPGGAPDTGGGGGVGGGVGGTGAKLGGGGGRSGAMGAAGRKGGVAGKLGGGGGRMMRHAQSEMSLVRAESDDSSSEEGETSVRTQLRRSKSDCFDLDQTLTKHNQNNRKPATDASKCMDRFQHCLQLTINELIEAGSVVCGQLKRLAPALPPATAPTDPLPTDNMRAKLSRSIEDTALALAIYGGGTAVTMEAATTVQGLVAMVRDTCESDVVVMGHYSDFLYELIKQLKN